MEDALFIYLEQIVSFCAIVYSNTNSLKLFCENSSLNFCVNSWKFTRAQTYYTQMPLVPLVTNSMSGMYFSLWTANFCCSDKDRCAILANLTNAPIHLLAKNVRTVPLQFKLRIFRGLFHPIDRSLTPGISLWRSLVRRQFKKFYKSGDAG